MEYKEKTDTDYTTILTIDKCPLAHAIYIPYLSL